MRKIYSKSILFSALLFLMQVPLFLFSQSVSDPSNDASYDAEKANRLSEADGQQYYEILNSEYNFGIGNNEESIMAGGCFIPVDGSYTAVPRNDDGSYGPISLPFTFSLYGNDYDKIWINTNGNITFTGPISWYSASGFPFSTPMVAPFWGDVDTRCGGGAIYFKVSPTNVVVTWNGVGYYSCSYSRLNTFQAIIGTYSDALTGVGQNVSLRYADMQWTTGNASSGSGGFGGVPATVGINKGDGSSYVQIGRFNQNSYAYDGPGGGYDGVNYLDNQCVAFNVSNAGNIPPSFTGLPDGNSIDLTCGESASYSITAIAPEVNQNVSISANTGGLCNVSTSISGSTLSLSVLADACNEGSHVVSLTATDNGNPSESTTVDITINVTNCCESPALLCPEDIVISADSNSCGAVAYYNATASGTSPVVSYSISSGSVFPLGSTEVFVSADNACGSDQCSFTVTVEDNSAPSISCPANMIVESDADQCGAVVNFPEVLASDNCDVSVSYSHQSGDFFPVGTTTVTAIAADGSGNAVSCSFYVTVEDTQAPVISFTNGTNYTSQDEYNNCSYTGWSINGGGFYTVESDNCSNVFTVIEEEYFDGQLVSTYQWTIGLGNSHPWRQWPVGNTTIVATVYDEAGNMASGSFVQTVVDNTAPEAVCQDVIVTLSEGVAYLTPEMIDNGSNDACGIAALELDVMSFDCSNIGSNPVVLTVTDNYGNSSSCTANVEVLGEIPSCAINVELENDTYTGGDGQTIFLGYGPQSLTAAVSALGGAPFTYSWSGDNGYLSSTSSESPVFSPEEDGIYDLVCEVTNAYGCTTICEVSICVMDIRAGGNGNNQKVYLCHAPPGNPSNAKTLKVSVNAVPAHLENHDHDRLGRCDQECGEFKTDFADNHFGETHDPVLSVYPNPTTSTFYVVLDSHEDDDIQLEIYDHLGKMVIQLHEINSNDIMEFGQDLPAGLYYVKVVQGEFSQNIKVVKAE